MPLTKAEAAELANLEFDIALSKEGISGKLADVARSIYQQESGSGSNTRTSYAGAVGGMQIIPKTFSRMADKGWDINNGEHNVRAGLRYIKTLAAQAGDDPRLIAAGYYGGEGAIPKARAGIAVRDQYNLDAPNTLQYADQVTARLPKGGGLTDKEAQELAALEKERAQPAKQDDFADVNTGKPEIGGKARPANFIEKNVERFIAAPARNLVGGAVRGLGGMGANVAYLDEKINDATGLGSSNKLEDMVTGASPESRRNARIKKVTEFSASRGADPESFMYGAGKIGSEIVATNPVLKGLGAGAQALGAERLGTAIASGGMSAGAAPGAIKNALARVAGGAGAGAGATAVIDPDHVGTGSAIGAFLPPVISGAGWIGSKAGQAIFNALTPELQKRAVQLASMTGAPIQDVIAGLRQQGPSLTPGVERTVPQILQNPDISQIGRTLKNSGQYGLMNREAQNSEALVNALERVAPTAGTINEARANAGNAIEKFARPAEKEASRKVSALFDSIPRDEARMQLPIAEMEAAKNKYLGPGSFGKGNAPVDQAIATAKSIGQEPVRRTGVSDLEILHARQNGLIVTIKQKFGLSDSQIQKGIVEGDKIQLDKILEGLTEGGGGYTQLAGKDTEHLRQMIQDEFSHLYDVKKLGKKIDPSQMHYPGDGASTAAQMTRAEEIARYGAPTAAESVKPKAVPFDNLQSLRSSIGEQITDARAHGRNQAAAALQSMKEAIDNKISSTVIGPRAADEVFTPKAADIYGNALAAHAAKKAQFANGPQAAIFRTGADGLPAREGAEIAPLFWNSGNAQIENMKAFKNLTKGDQQLVALMKSNATTEALQQGAKGPNQALTFDAFNKWMKNHSGAAKELFTDSELATLKAIGNETRIAAQAENMGRATGSNTAQNIFSMGALDNKLVNAAANYGPMKYLTGPVLNYVKNTTAQNRNEILSGLLSNPASMATALEESAKRGTNSNALIKILNDQRAQRLLARSAPVVEANR